MERNTTEDGRIQLPANEERFLNLTHAIGIVGLLILRRLRYLGALRGDVICTTPETDLAKHCKRSVATIKRYLNRLREHELIAVTLQGQGSDGRWLPNSYELLPAGIAYLAHFERGAPWLMPEPQILAENIEKVFKTCGAQVSHGPASEEAADFSHIQNPELRCKLEEWNERGEGQGKEIQTPIGIPHTFIPPLQPTLPQPHHAFSSSDSLQVNSRYKYGAFKPCCCSAIARSCDNSIT